MSSDGFQQRLWFIELIAYWEGRISSSTLVQQFAISRQQALRDIQRYQRLAPGNLDYDAQQKSYRPTADFQPLYQQGDVPEYLCWLSQQNPDHYAAMHRLPFDQLQLPSRPITPQLMRQLIQAMREQRRLDVGYVSLTNPDTEGRIIVPHHFVNTGLRWHLRAWCEKSGEYRDFVLSRFRGDGELMDKSSHGAEQDEGWNTEVILVFRPDSRLSEAQQQVLEQDYQMDNGELQLTTRGCLVQYLVQQMQVNIKMLDGNPTAQQLVLVNKSDIKRWLFDQ